MSSSVQDPSDLGEYEIGDLDVAEPGQAISALIKRECGEGLRPASRVCAKSRVVLSLFVSVGLSGALYAVRRGHEATPELETGLVLTTVAWGAIALAVLFLGLARPPGRRGGGSLRLGVALTVPVLFMAYLGAHGAGLLTAAEAHGAHGASAAPVSSATCGGTTLLFASLTAGGMWLVWRRTDPLTPRTSGALAGLVGGLSCALAVGLTCPARDTTHLYASHGLVVAGLMGLGWLVGRRALAP